MPNITPIHLVLILVIALLILGPGKLPDVGAALGKSIREFRKASGDLQESMSAATAPVQPAAQQTPSAPVAAAPVAPVTPQAGTPALPEAGSTPQPQA
ncbi:MAG TPA: twin-arginine translocase TatA/TatE family subunit [Candidatus Limnocylindrales bacterium]